MYGSPRINIDKILNTNKHLLFDIDWQGAAKLRKKYSKKNIIDFFILPPNKIELKKRLLKRGRDNKVEIKKRLSLAVREISHYNEYKYVLINDKINNTVNHIMKIIYYENFLNNLSTKIKHSKII